MINADLIAKLVKLPLDAEIVVGDGPDGRPNKVAWCGITDDIDIKNQIQHQRYQKIVYIQGENY